MRRWRWWATRLCWCRFGCSKYIAGCPMFALLELGLLTLQTVSHCHSADWGGVRETHTHTAWQHVTTAILRETSLKTWRNLISGRSWERQKQRDEVRLWQGQHPGQLWQHRSLFPAPPLLPRSQRVGVLLNQIQSAAPITNDTASVGMCWTGRKTHSFVTLQKIWSDNSSWVRNWHTL